MFIHPSTTQTRMRTRSMLHNIVYAWTIQGKRIERRFDRI